MKRIEMRASDLGELYTLLRMYQHTYGGISDELLAEISSRYKMVWELYNKKERSLWHVFRTVIVFTVPDPIVRVSIHLAFQSNSFRNQCTVLSAQFPQTIVKADSLWVTGRRAMT